ncbi:MAG: hypothetical protein QOF42_1526 [Gammaproteobacteria bacterium]|jgi:hypothetical protein|nr:hypothetical protein [Gammaproteobacteria bacterium]
MRKRALVHSAAAVSVVIALAACTSVSVKTDIAKDMSVAICHTYAFAPEHLANADQPAAYGNPLNAQRLKVAVQANLSAKGIQPAANRESADCMVGFALGSRQVFDDYYGGLYGGFGFGGGFGGGFGRRGFGGGFGGYYDGPWVQNEVRIAVDLFDARSHKPIWHASASQNTYELSGPNAEAKINLATAAIFNKLPPLTGGATT